MNLKKVYLDEWDIIDRLNWSQTETSDVDLLNDIRLNMRDILTDHEVMSLLLFVRSARKVLAEVLQQYAEEKTGNRHGYYGVSDDGFWDLTAHIVGCGKEVYFKTIRNPKLAKRRAESSRYVENFEYIFNYI